MPKLHINQNQFSDLLNLTHKVFYPLKKFINKSQFLSIINKMEYEKKFFPFPIFFGINREKYHEIKNFNTLDLIYKDKKIATIDRIIFFSINKKKFGKKIYGKKYHTHPFFKKFDKENYKFSSFRILKVFKTKYEDEKFVKPSKVLKKIKKLRFAAFHTRNVPHLAHQWIHKYLFNKYDGLLIQPMIGQYKSGEYKDSTILKLNQLVKGEYNNKNVLVLPFFSYPRYGGPREAALHALVRRNYGCKYFWIGRDHAGIKNFYDIYESQKFCKKIEKKINIKIIAEREPYFCKNKSKILNSCSCNNNCKIKISGTLIRKLIKSGKKIPNYLMSKNISKNLSKNSLIKS